MGQINLSLIKISFILSISYDASVKIKDLVENNDYVNVVIIAYTANQGDEELAKCKKHRKI